MSSHYWRVDHDQIVGRTSSQESPMFFKGLSNENFQQICVGTYQIDYIIQKIFGRETRLKVKLEDTQGKS